MPNFSKDERRVLSGEELELATRSRQPQLGALSDDELATLTARLRSVRDKVRSQGRQNNAGKAGRVQASGGTDTDARQKETFLVAALRRAHAEQNRRLMKAAQTAGAAFDRAQAVVRKASPVGKANSNTQANTEKPADQAQDDKGTGNAAAPSVSRKVPADQKTSGRSAAATRTSRTTRIKPGTQVTDRRSRGIRRGSVAKSAGADNKAVAAADSGKKPAAPKAKPAAGTAVRVATKTDTGKPATIRADKKDQDVKPVTKAGKKPGRPDIDKAAVSLVKKLTDKAAYHAAKAEKAYEETQKAVRQVRKNGGKKAEKALVKAEEKADKARRKARKSARRAQKAAADLG
ncbi:MAG: hypothetical protein ACK5II_13490 [Paracoccus sp. (in: a-proteobacteria)]